MSLHVRARSSTVANDFGSVTRDQNPSTYVGGWSLANRLHLSARWDMRQPSSLGALSGIVRSGGGLFVREETRKVW